MPLKSTSTRYGSVAIAFHWITAALIVVMLALGLNADATTDDDLKRAVLIPHIALGILTLLLTLARIAWWTFADRKPQRIADIPPLQNRIATIVHFLVYGFIIALAVTGIVTNVTSGLIGALASGAPIPELDQLGPRRAHGLLAWAFMALLAVHIAAALYHQFIRRDGLLARMGLGHLPPRTES